MCIRDSCSCALSSIIDSRADFRPAAIDDIIQNLLQLFLKHNLSLSILRQDTGDLMACTHVSQRNICGHTFFRAMRAASRKTAARRRIDGAGHLPVNHIAKASSLVQIRFQNSGKEGFGIGTVSYTHLDVYKRQV